MAYASYLFYKPYDVLSQFTKEVEYHKTLADYLTVESDVYPVGRLDRDSEGLLLLTNDKKANFRLLDPSNKKEKEYWVQVDGAISEEAIQQLSKGVKIKVKKQQYTTLPCQVKAIPTPNIEARNPPVRFRKNIPTSWISIILTEGKNRQVRRMCAAVGFPVLRLIRYRLGNWNINKLEPGNYLSISL